MTLLVCSQSIDQSWYRPCSHYQSSMVILCKYILITRMCELFIFDTQWVNFSCFGHRLRSRWIIRLGKERRKSAGRWRWHQVHVHPGVATWLQLLWSAWLQPAREQHRPQWSWDLCRVLCLGESCSAVETNLDTADSKWLNLLSLIMQSSCFNPINCVRKKTTTEKHIKFHTNS